MTQRNNYTDAFRQEAVRLLRESVKVPVNSAANWVCLNRC